MPRITNQTTTIEELQARFEEWRRTRQGRGAIPEALWVAAMELAQRDGVGRTAAALHLDSSKLKRRMTEAGMIAGKAPAASFVELMAPNGITCAAGLARVPDRTGGPSG